MRVLISGGGIAGPTLAWFLARTGASITIVEKAPSLLSQGQNIDMKGSAVTILNKMGLLDEVRKHNTTEKGTQFIDAKGKPFAPFPVKEGASVSFSSQFEILRGDLAAILHNATKDLTNVKYLFGTTIKEIVSQEKDIVKVELNDGTVHEFDVLVAADGQWSKVRKQCFPPEYVKVVDLGVSHAYFTTPRVAGDNDWWNLYFALRSKVITLRPDPHGTIRASLSLMYCNEAQKKTWVEAARKGRQVQETLLREEFGNAGWQSQRLLDSMGKATDFYFQTVQQIKMTKWSTSRVVCLGDAAWTPSPFTGMGTSLAIIGGYLLAGELGKLKEGEHPSKAFETYENMFRPFVEDAQKLPPLVPAVAHPGTPWKRWLLSTFLWTLSKIAAIPWVASGLGDVTADDGFKLPQYSGFDDEKLK